MALAGTQASDGPVSRAVGIARLPCADYSRNIVYFRSIVNKIKWIGL